MPRSRWTIGQSSRRTDRQSTINHAPDVIFYVLSLARFRSDRGRFDASLNVIIAEAYPTKRPFNGSLEFGIAQPGGPRSSDRLDAHSSTFELSNECIGRFIHELPLKSRQPVHRSLGVGLRHRKRDLFIKRVW
jgi:hypothetical protein